MKFPAAPVSQIWGQLVSIAQDEGRALPPRGWAYRQEEAWQKSRALVLHARKGELGVRQNGPYIKLDRSSVVPGDEYVMDNRVLDLMAIGAGGAPVRPWVTMVVDHRTLGPLGWSVTEGAPNRHSIMVAMRMAMLPKGGELASSLGGGEEFLCGLPKTWVMDHGKDFNARAIVGSDSRGRRGSKGVGEGELLEIVSGLAGDLGCGIRRSIPFNPRAKVVERFFRDMAMGFDALSTGYWGGRPDQRPAATGQAVKVATALWKEGVLGREEIARRSGLPLLESVCEALEAWCWRYWQREDGQGEGLRDEGRVFSPLGLWRRLAVVPRLVPSAERLGRWGMEVCERLVRRGYIQVDGRLYGGVELARMDGLRVQVRYSVLDRGSVLVEAVVGEGPLPAVLRLRECGGAELGSESDLTSANEVLSAQRRALRAAVGEVGEPCVDPHERMVERVRAEGAATGRGQVVGVPGKVWKEVLDVRDRVVDAAPLGKPVTPIGTEREEDEPLLFAFEGQWRNRPADACG
jgi:hypothetical protein